MYIVWLMLRAEFRCKSRCRARMNNRFQTDLRCRFKFFHLTRTVLEMAFHRDLSKLTGFAPNNYRNLLDLSWSMV